jgi:hypothetical protein
MMLVSEPTGAIVNPGSISLTRFKSSSALSISPSFVHASPRYQGAEASKLMILFSEAQP